jgi:PAS domain S-box-containing protein
LRTAGPDAAPAHPEANALIVPRNVAHVDPETQELREEVARLRDSLQQWTQAEAEWSQQRRLFQLMTDNVSDLIVLLDHQGHRTWNNAAYSHVMGYELAELAGTHALTEVHPDDRAKATEALTQTLEKGTIEQAEYRVQKKDGAWVQLQTETIPVLDGSGRVEAALLLAKDTTEKSKLSEALALATTQATATGLAEGMARDFDQILTNVVGNLTIAKNLNGPHNAIAVRLNEMERSLQRARDLIGQMFSVAPEQAQPKLRVHLDQTVQEAASEVLRGTMVRGEYLFPRNLAEIDVDLEAFTHAIRNIVTNSLEAMDKGVVRFSAENIPHTQFSYRHDLPLKVGDYVCLHIQDQGHGISEKALPRVFEPYFTTRSGSQGLGLTTALASVQRMGGTILVNSTPGVGTTLSIYLPAATGDAPIATMPLPTASTPAAHRVTAALPKMTGTSALPMPGHKRRILLMDDEQMILDIVSRMLGHLGYEVTTCTDGSQAIAAFAKAKSQGEPFDVVMMDLVIPNGVGGQDAVHTIKKIDPSAKVLASSGHLEHPVMLDHKKFGFNAVLEKPYKLEKLQQVIEAVINDPAT